MRGIAGGIAGSNVGHGDGRKVATVAGAIIGGVIGGNVGRRMDRADEGCAYQAFEFASPGQTVFWRNPDSNLEYAITPLASLIATDGSAANTRPLSSVATSARRARQVSRVATQMVRGRSSSISPESILAAVAFNVKACAAPYRALALLSLDDLCIRTRVRKMEVQPVTISTSR